MKWHKRVAELISCCDSTVPEFQSWDIEVNGELRLEWTEEYVVKNAVQIYKDLLEMEQEIAALRKYKESTQVYIKLADSIEAVFRARGWERGGLIR